jgi:hypothetical protein
MYAAPPLLISLTFYLISPNEISWAHFLLALALLQIPWTAYLVWKQRDDQRLPIFAIISLMYWIYYALALFWGSRTISGMQSAFEEDVPVEAITWSLGAALIGVSSIWLGMRVGLGRRLIPRGLPELKSHTPTLHYLRLLLILGTLLSFYENFPFIAGDGFRQVLTIIISTVPILAFAILFRRIVRGEAGGVDKVLVIGFLVLRFVIGLSSGWLGAFASIIVICGAIYVSEKRKLPRLAMMLVILFTLFFQVGKQEFRSVYWKTAEEASKIDRVKFWTEKSLSKWGEALSNPSGGALGEAISMSLSRVSLLTQTANVMDLTPSIIPYQQGHLYYYLLITWIPRAVWPDKPSMNDANQFYQVTYGLSTEEGLENVSIGVGVMTEAYISFGFTGIVAIMFLMGIFYDFYSTVCFTTRSGLLMTGIGIALLPQMMTLEAQMAAYLGGVVQQVLFTLLIFSPVIRWRTRRLLGASVINTLSPSQSFGKLSS